MEERQLETKQCSQCEEVKPLSEFYTQQKYSKKRGNWIYYNPKCKKCCKDNSLKWIWDNKEYYEEVIRTKYETTDKFKAYTKKNARLMKDYNKQWRRDNATYLRDYHKERQDRKKHDISKVELEALYKYCDNSCMYCGMKEEEHRTKFNQKLHKDHAVNEGSNGIDNCIMACKSCNVSKRSNDWNVWYTEENDNFTLERRKMIEYWLHNYKEIIDKYREGEN